MGRSSFSLMARRFVGIWFSARVSLELSVVWEKMAIARDELEPPPPPPPPCVLYLRRPPGARWAVAQSKSFICFFFGWPPVVFFFFIPNPTTRDDVEQSLTGATPDPKKIYRHKSGSIDSLLCDRINGAGAAPFPPLIDSVKRTLRSKKEEEKGKAGRDKKQEGKACSAAENNRNELLAAEYFSL